MTYDQAQSPRLGQRTPIESTFVQIFDVDPDTATADLIEAPWPGMLVFREDRGVLQIYKDPPGAWTDVAGGVAGSLTFVSATMPGGSGYGLGDTWYDSDDGYKPYVWNGTAWEPAFGSSVSSLLIEYAANTSATVPPSSGWSTTPPSYVAGNYVWQRTTTIYSDGTTIVGSPVLMTGNTGAPGTPGAPGAPGADGIAATIQLIATTQVLTQPAAGGATTPPTSIVTGTAYNTTITTWEYSQDSSAWSSTPPAGASRAGNVVTITGATMTAKTIAVRMGNGAGVYDTMTVAKVVDGAAGSPGSPGTPGVDGYTVLLTNEAHVFAGAVSNALAGSTVSQVIAYKGATQVAASIGTITGQVTGLTTTIQNNGTTSAQFTVTVTTALVTQNGILTIPITVDGKVFNQIFTWSVSYTGTPGSNGTPAAYVYLTATTQSLVSPAAGGATNPTTSTVTGVAVNTTITTWTYSVDSGAFSATVPAGVSRASNVVTITGSTMTAKTIAVRMADAAGVADTLTVAKVLDGSDSYTVLLSNESHTFPAGVSAALATSIGSTVIAYKGSVAQTATVGTITGGATGISAAVTNNGTTAPLITFTVTTSLTTGGTFTIPITVAGIVFTQVFSWGLAFSGAPGANGTNAMYVDLVASAQVLTSPAAGGATTPATATVTGVATATTITVYEYSVDSGAFSTSVPTGASRTGNVVTITGGTMTAKTITVRMADALGNADTMTVAKVFDGATGTPGTPGSPGADAYTVLLTNESHTFPGTTTTAVAGSTISGVLAYKGASQIASTIGTITGQVTGLTTSIQNNGTTTAQFTVTVTTSLVTQSGTLTIPLTIDSKSFTKIFTWTVAFIGSNGAPGTPGANGVSVTAITPYFAVTAVGAAAPAQPTASTPGAPWVTPEPAWTANTVLYRTEKVSYSNATWTYTAVSKVSANEGVNTKTRVFRQGRVAVGVPIGTAVGDIWYDTEDDNHPWYWDGSVWIDAGDGRFDDILSDIEDNEANILNQGSQLTDLQTSVANQTLLSTSANNTADTADGRVSMSDYLPGDDDLVYEQSVQELDTTVVPPVVVTRTYMVPRVNGSIWFTRTRPRNNVCTNPSFEANTTDWAANAANTTMARDNTVPVPAGDWTLKVTNTATTGTHYVSWGANNRASCAEGQIWTASIYAQLLTGVGAGCWLELRWYNSAGTYLSSTNGDTFTIVLNAFDPDLFGTVAEPRFLVTGTAPATATSVYVRVNNPNHSSTWNTGALLLEKEDDLGQYFDGDSFDGIWNGTRHNSTSHLVGDKIHRVFELRDGEWIQKFFTEDTLSLIDVSSIVGELDGAASIQDNTIPTDKMVVSQVLASEALVAGNIVNIWSNAGAFNARKASASLRYPAHGFVLDNVSSGAMAKVYPTGTNGVLVDLVPGTVYLSDAGDVSNVAPVAPGNFIQRLGFASNANTMNFQAQPPVRVT